MDKTSNQEGKNRFPVFKKEEIPANKKTIEEEQFLRYQKENESNTVDLFQYAQKQAQKDKVQKKEDISEEKEKKRFRFTPPPKKEVEGSLEKQEKTSIESSDENNENIVSEDKESPSFSQETKETFKEFDAENFDRDIEDQDRIYESLYVPCFNMLKSFAEDPKRRVFVTSFPPKYFFETYQDAERYVRSLGFSPEKELDENGDIVFRYYPVFMSVAETENYYKKASYLLNQYGENSEELYEFMKGKFPCDQIVYYDINRIFPGGSPLEKNFRKS